MWLSVHILGVPRLPGEILGGSKDPRFHFIDLELARIYKCTAKSLATLVTTIEAKADGVSFDFVQQALVHEEMKQSELFGHLSGAE